MYVLQRHGDVHIIIATPDGLCGYLSHDLVTFSSLRFVVFDETDLLLKMGFKSEIEFILNHKTMVSKVNINQFLFLKN